MNRLIVTGGALLAVLVLVGMFVVGLTGSPLWTLIFSGAVLGLGGVLHWQLRRPHTTFNGPRQLWFLMRNGYICRHDDENEIYPLYRRRWGFGCGHCGCWINYRSPRPD